MHKPLNTKINIRYYRLLDAMHRKSDIPKSRLIERALEILSKHLSDYDRGLALLKDIEDAERDYAEGRLKTWDQVKKEIEANKSSGKKRKL